jgi:hypothetical protein
MSTARRRGRTIGVAVGGGLLTLFTVVCSIEIIVQAWTPTKTPTDLDCPEGTKRLIAAVRRARAAASEAQGGEREAVARFREALEPEWSMRTAIGERCKPDEQATQALGEVDRLRYAEEHALRYEALDIASRRRRVEAIEERLARGR